MIVGCSGKRLTVAKLSLGKQGLVLAQVEHHLVAHVFSNTSHLGLQHGVDFGREAETRTCTTVCSSCAVSLKWMLRCPEIRIGPSSDEASAVEMIQANHCSARGVALCCALFSTSETDHTVCFRVGRRCHFRRSSETTTHSTLTGVYQSVFFRVKAGSPAGVETRTSSTVPRRCCR